MTTVYKPPRLRQIEMHMNDELGGLSVEQQYQHGVPSKALLTVNRGINMDGTDNVADVSGLPMQELLYGSSASTSGVSENIPKKRGRPRKVAVEGEDKRRKQMKHRKKKKNTALPRLRTVYVGENVNTTKMYLPEGWKCFAIRRSTGIHKGLFDLLYFAPNGGRIRSRNELFRWTKENNSDIDPLKFLFTRTNNVLLAEENAKNIIFRNAGLKGKTRRYTDRYFKNISGKNDLEECNTIFSERGREFLQDDNSSTSQSVAQSFPGEIEESEEQASRTPKKTQLTKPRRVPMEKTLECLKSPYFALKNQIPTKPVSIHAIHNSKWIPPRSPYNLIQEDLYHNPWQLLIATIFLNCTTGKLAIPVIHEFLARWPSPHEACAANLHDILDVVELLGLGRTRSATIIRFSHEYLIVDWKKPTELFGIGKYGNDSYKVFCLGQWRTVESEDKYLNLYINWLQNVSIRSSNANRSSRGSTALVPK